MVIICPVYYCWTWGNALSCCDWWIVFLPSILPAFVSLLLRQLVSILRSLAADAPGWGRAHLPVSSYKNTVLKPLWEILKESCKTAYEVQTAEDTPRGLRGVCDPTLSTLHSWVYLSLTATWWYRCPEPHLAGRTLSHEGAGTYQECAVNSVQRRLLDGASVAF